MNIDEDMPKQNSDIFSSENVTKIAIEILRGSAVTQNNSGGLVISIFLQISCSVYVPKIIKNRLTHVKVMTKTKQAIFWDTVYYCVINNLLLCLDVTNS